MLTDNKEIMNLESQLQETLGRMIKYVFGRILYSAFNYTYSEIFMFGFLAGFGLYFKNANEA